MTKNFIGHSIWRSMVMSLGYFKKFSWQVVLLITLKMIEEFFWASYIPYNLEDY
jgi:membrane protein DedA with SNARE-associated domain